ncbi:hypothetical protein VNO80_15618 [Phaseolus coccineus]|uniref:Uncharacterized protein n=1 Tax=Phaseolus coccineus TaxID=3886 RepID=A0AAN9MRR8_PHACN
MRSLRLQVDGGAGGAVHLISLKQHNGELNSGAKASRAGRPWICACIICGFTDRIEASIFESKWKAISRRAPRKNKNDHLSKQSEDPSSPLLQHRQAASKKVKGSLDCTHFEFICVSMATDSRKRTLEALERRIAFAKAEVLQKERKSEESINEERKSLIYIDSTSKDPSPHLLHSSSVTPKKGNFSFSSHTNSKEIQDDPVYAQLSVPVNANLLPTSEFSAERGGSIKGILHELLQKGDAAQKYVHGSKNMKIDNWILLDNYGQGRVLSSGSQTRALQIHSKRSKKHMSMRQHKKWGSLHLPQEFQKFDIFKPMREMWKDYVMLLLKSTGKNQLTQCLLGADLHGAFILVVECKRTYFTGICGIMICETAEAFGIITEDDKFRVVPKKGSVFVFQVDCWKVTLHGDKLGSRKIFSLKFECVGTFSIFEIQDGPVYAQLSVPINANMLPISEFSAERRGSIDGILHEILQKGDVAQKFDIFKPEHEMWKDSVMLLLKSTGYIYVS